MANVSRTIDIIFQGKDELTKSVKSIENKLSSFSSGIQGATEPLANMAKSILKTEAALIALGVGGLVFATSKAIEFETSSVNLSKILGDEKDQIESVEDSILSLSNKYGEGANLILASTTDFKRAGFNVAESMKLVEDSIGLVIGAAEAELDIAKSSEIIISTLKGFNAPASEAARLTDILNKVSNEYATSVVELGQGMATLSPIAASMGFSFEETAGLLTPVIEVFRSGEESSRGLKTGLLRLTSETKPVQDALAKLGVIQKDVNGDMRSGKDILLDVQKAYQGLTDNQKSLVTQQLAGKDQAAKLQIVFDNLAKTTNVAATALEATGSITQEVVAKLNTGGVAVNRFKVGFENLAIVVGDQFLESAKGAIKGGAEIENALQKIIEDGSFQPVFDVIDTFAKNLEDDLSLIAKNLPEAFKGLNWDALLESFNDLGKELTRAFNLIFGDLDLTKPEDLQEAVQKIINGFTSLTNTTAGILSGLKPLFAAIGEGIDGFTNLDAATQKAGGSILGIGTAINSLVGFLGVLGPALGILAGSSMTNAVASLGRLTIVISSAAGVTPLLTQAVTLSARSLGAAGFAGALGFAAGKLINTSTTVQGFAESIAALTDRIFDWTGMQKYANEGMGRAITVGGGIARVVKDYNETLEQTPEQVTTDLVITAKGADAQAVTDILKGQGAGVKILTYMDPISADETLKALEKIAPPKKEVEVDIQVQIAKIKAQADLAQKALELKVQLDIKNAEIDLERLQTVFDSINNTVDSTGGLLDGLFGNLSTGFEDIRDKWKLWDQIDKENEMREKAFELQQKMLEEELKLQKAKRERYEKTGEMPILKVEAAGLKPHLEAFMWEILEAIQIRANEEQSEFLLGI